MPPNRVRGAFDRRIDVFLCARGFLKQEADTHDWVALVPENFVHQKFISDLGSLRWADVIKGGQAVVTQVSS